jgi:hypothetical protein
MLLPKWQRLSLQLSPYLGMVRPEPWEPKNSRFRHFRNVLLRFERWLRECGQLTVVYDPVCLASLIALYRVTRIECSNILRIKFERCSAHERYW